MNINLITLYLSGSWYENIFRSIFPVWIDEEKTININLLPLLVIWLFLL